MQFCLVTSLKQIQLSNIAYSQFPNSYDANLKKKVIPSHEKKKEKVIPSHDIMFIHLKNMMHILPIINHFSNNHHLTLAKREQS